MEFRILGPLEVVDDGRVLPLGAPRQRALLAALLVRPSEIVSTDRLVDDVWNDNPPATASKVVQVYVSQLRKALGDNERLLTRSPGYLLRVEPHELDLNRFEQLFEDGRRALAAGDAERAATTIREALEVWRGPPLCDLALEPFLQPEIARLEDRKLAATTERIEAELALGAHGELVPELERLVAEHPYQERLRGQLMLALYRSGRQTEALQAYQDARLQLGSELGLEPGKALQALEQAILNHDSALDAPAAPVSTETGPTAPFESSVGGAVTFAELVWEHFCWARERRTGGAAAAAAEASYRRKLAEFEAREGRIVDAYWCRREASAAALTVRPGSLVGRLVGSEPTIRVHRVSDWISKEAPAVAELLFQCDAVAFDAGEALRRGQRRRALERVFAAETHLLGLLERTGGRPSPEQTADAARQTAELLAPVQGAMAQGRAPRRLAR
jgi:DNA-binding SARP family transcriptional activator